MITLVKTYDYTSLFLSEWNQLAVLGNRKESWIAYCHKENIHPLLDTERNMMTLSGGNKDNIIIQDMMSALNCEPGTNWIKIYNPKQQAYIQSYDIPILIRNEISIGNNYYLCTKKNKLGGETLLSFNPFTKETGWEADFKGLKNKIRINYVDQDRIMIENDNFMMYCYSTKGILLWQFDANPYFTPKAERREIETIQYVTLKDIFIVYLNTVYLNPSKLIAINASTGNLVWETDFLLDTRNFILDQSNGTVCLITSASRLIIENLPLDYFRDNDERHECIIYQVIDAGNGKTIIWKDITEAIMDYDHVLDVWVKGVKDECVYATSIEFGGVYRLDKRSGELLEAYRYGESFSGIEAFYNDHFYITTDTRLLVLKI